MLVFKVAGILADGAKIPDNSRGYEKEAFDFRNLYHNYSYETDGYPVMFVSRSKLESEGVHSVPAFTQLVTVNSVSISTLSTKSSLKVYGIYYLCGSMWKSCIAMLDIFAFDAGLYCADNCNRR